MFSVFIFLLWHQNVFGLVGGKNVTIQQAPFQANYADICGAVIIHQKWVLTTAHCGADGTFIRVGSTHRLSGTKVQIQRHIIHPKYAGNGQYDFDLQLLKLYKELRFWRHVRSVEISKENCEGDLEVFGWGYQREKGDYTSHLQMIKVQRVPIQECEKVPQLLHHEIKLTPRMFCAKGFGQDACQGDSGGAAISSGLLIGLSSFGYGCGRGYPGVYVSLTERTIKDWIKHHTGV